MNDDLVPFIGKEFDFYGAADNQFRIDDSAFLVIEEQDDYRSSLGAVRLQKETTILFRSPIARVKIIWDEGRNWDLYRLVDISDNHEWLVFGTESTYDYYPYFVFEYNPKKMWEAK